MLKINISNSTWLSILFFVTCTMSIILHFTEDSYSLQQLSFDIQSAMFLVAILFYKEN